MFALAVGCVAVLAYTYVGYPVLIWILARLFPLPVSDDRSFEPTVTACIAVHNGGRHVARKIRSLLDQDYPREKLEILVYSDESDDDTDAIVSAWAAREPSVRLLRGDRRSGKPTGLNRMREEARGEVLLLTDVRQPFNRGATRALLERLADPSVGCVGGSLVLEGAAGSGAYWLYEKFIRRQEARFRGMVGVSGSISVVRKSDLGPLPSDLILDDVWIPMRLRLQGRRILFAEGAEAYDEAFEDDREFGRKVRTLAGNFQLFARMPALLLPFRNPSWLETFSHKVLRLACPLALVLLALSSGAAVAWEPRSPLRTVSATLLGGQALLYGAAIVGPRAGRVCALARTFVVMNAAAVVGLWRFLGGRQQVTW